MQPHSPEMTAPSLPRLRPVRPLGPIVALAIVALAVAGVMPGLINTWADYNRAQQVVAGTLSIAEALQAQLDAVMVDAVLAGLRTLGGLTVAVLFLMWLWRARANADAFSPAHHTFSPGWAIGGFLVPLVNWVVPAIVMNDLALASDPRPARGRVHPLVAGWWSALVLSSVLLLGAFFTAPDVSILTYDIANPTRVVGGAEEALASFRTVALLNTAMAALVLTAGVLAAVLVTRISTQQARWSGASRPAAGAYPDAPAPAASAAERAGRRATAPSRWLGNAAIVLMWLALAGPVVMLATGVRYSRGEGGRDLALVMLAGIGATLAGVLAAGVLVIAWTARARSTAEALSPAPHRLDRSWAVAGWFVPLAHLALPPLVMRDVLRAGAGPSLALPVWWASWLGAWAALYVAFGVSLPDTPEAMAGFSLFAGLALALFTTAAACLSAIIRQVDRWQTGRLVGATD